MLAARRSFGNLRTAARLQSQQQQQPCAIQQRTFMSAVLLSRDQFQGKTVVELKKQLSERGLSTKGKKKDLVDRLVDSVSHGTFGGASSSSSSSKISSQPSQQAAFSTTARAQAAETETNANKPIGSVVESAEIPVHAPAVSAAATAEATAGSGIPDDEIQAGPGHLVNKAEAEQVAEKADEVPGGAIEMPSSTAVFLPSIEQDIRESQYEMMIPEMPHTYKNAPDHDPHMQPFTLHPSWLKVDASAHTVHHAGSSAPVTEDQDSRSSEPRQEVDLTDNNTFLQDLLSNFGIKSPKATTKRLEGAGEEVRKETSAILSLLEETSGVKIPPLSQSLKKKGGKEEKFKFQDRPLNSEETTGLWILSGILGGGLLLGSLGNGSKKTKNDEKTTEKKDSH